MEFCVNCGYESSARTCPVCGGALENDPSGAPDALKPGTLLHGKTFRVGRLLKSGPCLVYLGCDQNKRKLVVIKEAFGQGARRNGRNVVSAGRSTEEALAALDRSCRLLERVQHPSVPQSLIWFQENGTLYAVYEHRPGKTLRDAIEDGPLTESPAVALALRLAEAVEAVHEAEIVHRDLNPSNFVVAGDIAGTVNVSLIDFGEAADTARLAPYATADLVWDRRRGTPGYAPPEQYDSRTSPHPSADVYGLGATLYFLLTGHDPPDAQARSHDDQMLASLGTYAPGTSSQTRALIATACALDPAERPGIGALTDSLRAPVPSQSTSPAVSSSVPSQPQQNRDLTTKIIIWALRNPQQAIVGAGVLAALLLFAAFGNSVPPLNRSRQKSPEIPAAAQVSSPQPAAPVSAPASPAAIPAGMETMQGSWYGQYDTDPASLVLRAEGPGWSGTLTVLSGSGFYQVSVAARPGRKKGSIELRETAVLREPPGTPWHLRTWQSLFTKQPANEPPGYSSLVILTNTGSNWMFDRVGTAPLDISLEGSSRSERAPDIVGRWVGRYDPAGTTFGERRAILQVDRQHGDAFDATLSVEAPLPEEGDTPLSPGTRDTVNVAVTGFIVPGAGRVGLKERRVLNGMAPGGWQLGWAHCILNTSKLMVGERWRGGIPWNWERAGGDGVVSGAPVRKEYAVGWPPGVPGNHYGGYTATDRPQLPRVIEGKGAWEGVVRHVAFREDEQGRILNVKNIDAVQGDTIELWEGRIPPGEPGWWQYRRRLATSHRSGKSVSLRWKIRPGWYTLYLCRPAKNGVPGVFTAWNRIYVE